MSYIDDFFLNKTALFNIGKPKSKANEYAEEDLRLWRLYKQGDINARNELLKRFRGMISSVAMKHSSVLPRPVVEAKLKTYTLKAFDTYNPNKNTKLSSHVGNYLKQIFRQDYKSQQAIRLPENLQPKYRVYTEGMSDLSDRFGREPNTAELAQHLGWSLKAVENAQKKFHKELVESKQTYDAAVEDEDLTQSVLQYVYHELNDTEKYVYEHITGAYGKKVYPKDKIRRDLKLTPYQFNKLMKGLVDKFKNTRDVLSREV